MKKRVAIEQMTEKKLVKVVDLEYQVIDWGDGPKCGWCGIDAKDLPFSHFEDHERKDKEVS